MKHLKTKLLATLAMLVIATVMMSTASYAWFTLSTNPSMEGLEGSVACNGNLEIALYDGTNDVDESGTGDTGDYYTWGNFVDLSSFTLDELKPVTFDDGTIKDPTFGDDGRLNADTAFTDISTGTRSTTSGEEALVCYEGVIGRAYSINFALRSNEDGVVSLCAAATRGNDDTVKGQGSTCSDDRVTIVFYDQTSYVTAAIDDDGVVTADVTTLTANEATYVTMYIFVDAEDMTNEELTNTKITDLKINIQFSHATSLTPLAND